MSSVRTVTDSPIVVALDYADRDRAMAFVDRIDPASCRLKVGKEMFTLFGPQLVRDLQQRGFELFLDLKFHDIPNTVAHAVAAAADLGRNLVGSFRLIGCQHMGHWELLWHLQN